LIFLFFFTIFLQM